MNRKETPSSKAQRVNEGFTPLYLQCLGIRNNACTSSTGFYSKAYHLRFLVLCSSFSLRSFHALLTRVEYHKKHRETYKSKSEWIFSRQTYPMHYDYSSKTNKFCMQTVLNKARKLKHDHA